MSERNSRLLLEDILLSIDKINEYTNQMPFDEFLNDSKTSDAVIRNFEIIGEAANRLPEKIKRNTLRLIGIEYAGFVIESFMIIWELTSKWYGLLRKIFFLN